MAERCKDSCDSSSANSCEDFESTSGSSSSEESTSEDEPEMSTAPRSSGFRRKKKNSQPRSSSRATSTTSEKQQTKKTRTKKNSSLSKDQIEELTTWTRSWNSLTSFRLSTRKVILWEGTLHVTHAKRRGQPEFSASRCWILSKICNAGKWLLYLTW